VYGTIKYISVPAFTYKNPQTTPIATMQLKDPAEYCFDARLLLGDAVVACDPVAEAPSPPLFDAPVPATLVFSASAAVMVYVLLRCVYVNIEPLRGVVMLAPVAESVWVPLVGTLEENEDIVLMVENPESETQLY
jgi:hypothetical protein